MRPTITSEYIAIRAAVEVSGLSAADVNRHADERRIRTVRSSGRTGSRLFNREDLLRVAAIIR